MNTQSKGKVSVTNGCYIDGCIPRTDLDRMVILRDLLLGWNPYHEILKEVFNAEYIQEHGSEIIDDFTNAINESIDDSQCATWINGGEFMITDCEE